MEYQMEAIFAQISMNHLASHHLKLILLKIFKCQDQPITTGEMNMIGNETVFLKNILLRNHGWKDHILSCRKFPVICLFHIGSWNDFIVQDTGTTKCER